MESRYDTGKGEPLRIYIAGPITGKKNYMNNFVSAENELIAAGHEVVNPAKLNLIVPDTYTQQEYMSICIPLLNTCDAVFCLNGWQHSHRANQEVAHCMETGKAIFFEKGVCDGKKNEAD